MSTSEATADPAAELRAARRRLAAAESAVADHGEAALERVRDALERAEGLLARYEGPATGTGDFQAFVEFQGKFGDLVEGLPGDLPARDAFEAANGTIDQRRLSEADFATARDRLAPARDLVDLLAEREDARAAVREAERGVETRVDELEDRIADRERVLELGEAFAAAAASADAAAEPTPTDADVADRVADLRETVETYDEAVRESFVAFRRDASARAFLRFVADTAHYPLVGFEPPPRDLLAYVEDHEVGADPLPDLLEYADYSASKLGHYVADPDAFRARVPVHRTYLDRLSAEPLTVGWPPPPAGELRALAGELVSVVAKFADEAVVARARALRRAVVRHDYERLRRVAVAEAELTDAEREALESGAVREELEAARAERERLRAALADADAE